MQELRTVSVTTPTIFESPSQFYSDLATNIRSAQRSVHLKFFTFERDSKTQPTFDAMRDALHANPQLDIRIILDHRGNSLLSSLRTRREIRNINKETGGNIQTQGTKNIFHKGGLSNLFNALHKKAAVIDAGEGSQSAYLGGMNISGRHVDFSDLMLHLHDPAVIAFLEKNFEKTWNHTNHQAYAEKLDGQTTMHSLVRGKEGNRQFINYLREKISQTQKGERIWLETGYLDKAEIRQALIDAKKKGVDVQIITAHPLSDNHDVRYRLFPKNTAEPLVANDVPLFLYHGKNPKQPDFNHAKILIINNAAFIGSFNWTTDVLSGRNEELVMETVTPQLVELLAEKFQHDKQQSQIYSEVKQQQPTGRRARW